MIIRIKVNLKTFPERRRKQYIFSKLFSLLRQKKTPPISTVSKVGRKIYEGGSAPASWKIFLQQAFLKTGERKEKHLPVGKVTNLYSKPNLEPVPAS